MVTLYAQQHARRGKTIPCISLGKEEMSIFWMTRIYISKSLRTCNLAHLEKLICSPWMSSLNTAWSRSRHRDSPWQGFESASLQQITWIKDAYKLFPPVLRFNLDFHKILILFLCPFHIFAVIVCIFLDIVNKYFSFNAAPGEEDLKAIR